MERSNIKRLALKTEGFEIELEKEGFPEAYVHSAHMAYPQNGAGIRMEEKPTPFPAPQNVKPEGSYFYVSSPMVGTFYASPSPDDPPFVKVGDSVNEETVVCIIEAMKVMNEVKSQVQGKIVEVLLKNGDPVEFGTKIFRIEK